MVRSLMLYISTQYSQKTMKSSLGPTGVSREKTEKASFMKSKAV